MMLLKYKKISPHAISPTRSHDGDLGYDLHSLYSVTIQPNEKEMVRTGVAFQFPAEWGGFIKDRSSMATQTTLEVVAGVIDNGYTGEVSVVFANYGTDPVTLIGGQKVAQMVLIPVPNFELEEVDNIDTTDRAENGFGSTGK